MSSSQEVNKIVSEISNKGDAIMKKIAEIWNKYFLLAKNNRHDILWVIAFTVVLTLLYKKHIRK